MSIKIRFWGVRGSIASPGPATAGVGGNTSSVEVRCGGRVIALDAGTGLRAFGNSLMKEGAVDLTMLLSHHHWDHIQGLPFFVPLYLPTTKLTVLGPKAERHGLHEVLSAQMSSPVFPVRLEEIASRLETRELWSGPTLTANACNSRARSDLPSSAMSRALASNRIGARSAMRSLTHP